MSNQTQCPNCGAVVSAHETFCTHCFWDLRSASEPAAGGRTGATQPQRPAPASPGPANYDAFAPSPAPSPVPSADVLPVRTPAPTPPRAAARPPAPAPSSPAPTNPAPINPAPGAAYDAGGDRALPFRPRLRPPMAILRVLDDEGADAESVRVRVAEFTIGRSEGDLVIPHERLMSSRHAKIVRRYLDGAFRWFLVDLNSTNGTFVKVSSGKLHHGAELLFGSFRYQFNAAPQGEFDQGDAETTAPGAPQRTMGWVRVNQEDLLRSMPKLSRISPGGEVVDFPISRSDLRIGADPGQADLSIVDDPYLSSLHLRLHQDEHQRWHVEDLGSKNGLWVAVREQELDRRAMFQLGEQRFSIRFAP